MWRLSKEEPIFNGESNELIIKYDNKLYVGVYGYGEFSFDLQADNSGFYFAENVKLGDKRLQWLYLNDVNKLINDNCVKKKEEMVKRQHDMFNSENIMIDSIFSKQEEDIFKQIIELCKPIEKLGMIDYCLSGRAYAQLNNGKYAILHHKTKLCDLTIVVGKVCDEDDERTWYLDGKEVFGKSEYDICGYIEKM